MLPTFSVRFYQDDQYEVWRKVPFPDDPETDEWISVFKGSLADCLAYVELTNNEKVDF